MLKKDLCSHWFIDDKYDESPKKYWINADNRNFLFTECASYCLKTHSVMQKYFIQIWKVNFSCLHTITMLYLS